MPRKTVNTFFNLRHACSKGVLRTQTFNNRSSALTRPDSYRELSGGIGNYRPSHRRNFHSSRRSGGVYSLFFIVF